jgi:hypothetical protein
MANGHINGAGDRPRSYVPGSDSWLGTLCFLHAAQAWRTAGWSIFLTLHHLAQRTCTGST